MAGKKRYVLTLTLAERDATETRPPRWLCSRMFYRAQVEGEARLVFDRVLEHLKELGIDLEHDGISRNS